MSTDADSLGRTSVHGVMWNFVAFGLSKMVVFVTTVILARVLEPADFGLLSLGLLVIGYLDFVNNFGISAAVIQDDGDPDRTADVAFWLNMVLGVCLTLLGFLAAPFIAEFFREPRAADVIRVLSFTFVLTSIGAIHEARLRKGIRFKSRVGPELSKGVVKGAISITLALLGYGVWSLVWGQLAGALVASMAYWVADRWRPSWYFDWVIAKKLLGFGSHVALVGLLGGLHKNIDYLFIGRQLGTSQLGIYTIAFRMPQLLIESVVDVTGQVAFPAFSRVRSDPERLRGGLRRMLRLIALIIVPLGLGLALIADPFVTLFYGERWNDAIPVMQLLALYMLVHSLSKTCGDVYKAMGRPQILSKLAVVKLVVAVPLLFFAAPYGIVAVAWAQLGSAIVLTAIRLWLAARITGADLRFVLGSFVPALRSGLAMTVTCGIALFALAGASPWLTMLAVTAVGAATYLLFVYLFDRAELTDLADLLKKRRAPTVEVR